MLPIAGLSLPYWCLLTYWLGKTSPEASPVLLRTIAVMGPIASLALALYATLLGAVRVSSAVEPFGTSAGWRCT
ncbi:MAG: hypothetical protein IPM37_21100 [Hahellaceae bacterium]|nr:hypothetical protein [Hahellaceae bacterium]